MSQAAHAALVVAARKRFVTTRGENYKNKVGGQGYVGPKHQVHHVLPCISLTQSKEEFLSQQRETGVRRAVETTTIYSVNDKGNLIGLPSRRVYASKFGTKFAVWPRALRAMLDINNPLVAACNLPIHLWNHPAYSRKAKDFADGAWAQLSLKIKQHKPVSATDIGNAFKAVSNALRLTLENPAAIPGRTSEAWHDGDKAAFDMPA
jgi:hypothetical protein